MAAGGQVSALYGTDNHVVLRGSLNTPIADGVYLRTSGAYTHQDGYVDKPANGRDTGDQNRLSLRSHLRLEASETFTIDVIGDYTRERTNGAAYVLLDTNATGLAPVFPDGIGKAAGYAHPGEILPVLHGIVPGKQGREIEQSGDPDRDRAMWMNLSHSIAHAATACRACRKRRSSAGAAAAKVSGRLPIHIAMPASCWSASTPMPYCAVVR